MSSAPLISIVTPCFNSERYIVEAIESVGVFSEKGDKKVEHIIVDGGSTDQTVELIKKKASEYNIRWISEKDDGLYEALNKALLMAEGDYIGWLNADDVYAEGVVRKVVGLIECGVDCDVYSSDAEMFFCESGVVKKLFQHYRGAYFSPNRENLCYAHLNSCFIKRSVYMEVGKFDDAYKIAADRDYLLKLLQLNLTNHHIGTVGMRYRSHAGSLTFSGAMLKGGHLPLTHPLRSEIMDICKKSMVESRSYQIKVWAVSKIIKYKAWGILTVCFGRWL